MQTNQQINNSIDQFCPRYIFGPVISRRLGASLGINLVPRKKCNLDCLYCEVCPTDKHDENRIDYVNTQDLVEEIKSIDTKIDYLTLTGFGEPTLHKNLDKIISALKREFKYPVAMITNSLLLRGSAVRKELLELDLIVPSLDAVSQNIFEVLTRPVPGVKAEEVVEGLVKFREEFFGKMWLEILFVKGINDSKDEVFLLSEAINKIKPDRVQLNTVVRLPAYDGVNPLSLFELEKIANMLSYKNIDIIGVG